MNGNAQKINLLAEKATFQVFHFINYQQKNKLTVYKNLSYHREIDFTFT